MMLKIGSFQSCTMLRSASPDSNKPVHWIITNGSEPPSMSPPATPQASPSRHTRTRRVRPLRSIASCHGPIVLSGTVTTCVTPMSARTDAICSPENMTASVRSRRHRMQYQVLDEELHHPRGVEARVALVRAHLQVEALARVLECGDELHHVGRM